VVWLIIISVLVLGEVPELLSGARQVVHPKEGLLLVLFLSLDKNMLSDFPGIQDDCKVSAKRIT
jgi:hypothetical protein